MKINSIGLTLILLACLFTSRAMADFSLLVELGIHEGGDDIATASFTDGTERDVQAGEFLSIGAGIAWDMGDVAEWRLVHGWKGDEISASNGSLDFTRWTTNLTLMFAAGNWRFGGGGAYHWDIELEGSGVASSVTSEFDDAIGAIAELDYYFHENAYIGLQYVNIDYDRLPTNGNTARTFDASSIGLIFAGRW